MRKILLFCLTVILSCSFCFLAQADVMYGDVDHSEAINASDALLVLKHAAKIEFLNNADKIIADVNGDLVVDATDALDILKYAAKLVNSFPVENAEPNPTEEATPEATETTKPKITPLPTDPMESVGPGVWPTMIPLPEVSADTSTYIEGTAAELVSLNGATEADGIYTFTDENKTNRKGISFKNPFEGKSDLVESFDKAFEGQEINLTDTQKLVYDPEAVYPEPVWNTGVSLSFWAKYDWDSEYVSDDDAILVLHRAKKDGNDFAIVMFLDGSVRFEQGEDATNSFRADGAVCGKYNEWNHYTLTIKNDWITVYVNGQECAYHKVSLTKGAIGLFNGGYMTKYNVPGEISAEKLEQDIRYYYKTSGAVSNGSLTLEAKRIDTGVYEASGYYLKSKLLMECVTDSDTELLIGGTTTTKVIGTLGNATYGIKSGTQAAGLKAYYTELSPVQVATIYANEAKDFLK